MVCIHRLYIKVCTATVVIQMAAVAEPHRGPTSVFGADKRNQDN